MKVVKLENGRKIKWFMINEKGEAVAGFTTKRKAEEAKNDYEKQGFFYPCFSKKTLDK